ncbi:fimbria/pilus outer membrane usher protein [Tepidicaulis sp.]|uniref:fimbria/pilus outer membrane usher protein n=1 Tax=Tepidicaulis sp. TaxID=1920809 RepID=UPI003B59FA3B
MLAAFLLGGDSLAGALRPVPLRGALDAQFDEAVTGSASERSQKEDAQYHFLLPIIDGKARADVVSVLVEGGMLFLPLDLLNREGIAFEGEAVQRGGKGFIAADRLSGMRASFNIDKGTLDLVCLAGCEKRTMLSVQPSKALAARTEGAGAFFNYDISADWREGESSGGLLGEGVVFSGLSNARAVFTCAYGAARRCTRLESHITHDDPAGLARLTLGDTLTQPQFGEAPLRFGGIKWGTEFSLQPGFITFPTLDFTGEAQLPGAVDLFINGVRRFQGEVPEGPFSLGDIPAVQGSGEVTVVLRDALGRERQVTEAYYASPQLLRPGLAAYSLEAGFLREGFGLRSNAYDTPFAAALYRRGLTNNLTLEGRAQGASSFQSLGSGLSAAFSGLGALDLSATLSRSNGEGGIKGAGFYEWRAAPFSAAFSYEAATPGFRRLGQDDAPPRATARGQFAVQGEGGHSLSLSLLDRDERGSAAGSFRSDFRSAGLTLSGPIGGATYRLSALRLLKPEKDFFFGAFLSFPLGEGSGALGADYDGEGWTSDLRYRKDAAAIGEVGYSARLSRGGTQREEAGLEYRSSIGDAALLATRFGGTQALRLSARGAAVLAGGKAALAPPITGSFAIVDVGNEKDVRIYQDRRLVARTDGSGRAVLTSLRAYEENRLSIDPHDLPLRTSFDVLENIVVPGARTGHLVTFKKTGEKGAVIYLTRADGTPFPEGWHITRLDGDGKPVPVGRGGRVFLEAGIGLEISFQTPEGRCRVTALPPSEARASRHRCMAERQAGL